MLDIITGQKNKILRNKSQLVKDITPEVLSLIKEMKETLAAAKNGVGLAAPQVGRNVRLFVVAQDIAKNGHTVFINPAITQVSKKDKDMVEEEGCLSLPGDWYELARVDKVTIKATDETGAKFKIRAKGLLARLMLHEVDHLNGILFIDHLKNKK